MQVQHDAVLTFFCFFAGLQRREYFLRCSPKRLFVQLRQITANSHNRFRKNLRDGFRQLHYPKRRFMNHSHRNTAGNLKQLFPQVLFLARKESVKSEFPRIKSADRQCGNPRAASRNRNNRYPGRNTFTNHLTAGIGDTRRSRVCYQYCCQILFVNPCRQHPGLTSLVMSVAADQRCMKPEHLAKLHRNSGIFCNDKPGVFHGFNSTGRKILKVADRSGNHIKHCHRLFLRDFCPNPQFCAPGPRIPFDFFF